MIIKRQEIDSSILERIRKGAVFVYPTDTIYGLGCDARNQKAVTRLREIKRRDDRPLSIIAPSKDWIMDNFLTDDLILDWIKKLPGPYTLIINTERGLFISEILDNVNPKGLSIGVRIPDHWISELVSELGIPIVTTSVNISGAPYMTSQDDIDLSIKDAVDFIIDDGVIDSTPSEKIFLCDNGDISIDNLSDR